MARALEHMADGFLSVDLTWRVTFVNRNAEVLVGAPERAFGRVLWDVWPELVATGLDHTIHEAVRSGGTKIFTYYLVPEESWFQVRVVTHTTGTSLFASDVTASRAAELESHRVLARPDQARAVLAYSAALADADTLADVIDVVGTTVLPAFGAAGMLVSLVEAHRLRLAGHAGYPQGALDRLSVLDAEEDVPIARVLRTRKPLFLPSRASYLSVFPGSEALVEATEKNAWASMPLTVSGRPLSLTISFAEPREFAPDERSLLVSVAGLLAQTLARARLRDSKRSLAAEPQQQLLPRALPVTEGLVATARYLAATDGTLSLGSPEDLEVLADAVLAAAADPEHRSDDAALLLVRHDGLPQSSRPVHDRTSIDRLDPRAARAARDFIAGHLPEPQLTDLHETAVLLVSEVVTYALRHSSGSGSVDLELWRFSDRVRVEVCDETSRVPVASLHGPLEESGRGVPLMDALSDRWGTSPNGEGKVVWFELDLPDP